MFSLATRKNTIVYKVYVREGGWLPSIQHMNNLYIGERRMTMNENELVGNSFFVNFFFWIFKNVCHWKWIISMQISSLTNIFHHRSILKTHNYNEILFKKQLKMNLKFLINKKCIFLMILQSTQLTQVTPASIQFLLRSLSAPIKIDLLHTFRFN